MGDESNSTDRFETFLAWLDPDRETAGQKYEEIRLKLVKLFCARKCYMPDELADETIDRVIEKCGKFVDEYVGDPALYFYGVAQKVFLESTRRPKTVELPPILEATPIEAVALEREAKHECLKECLAKLNPSPREFLLEYYNYSGTTRDKVSRRKELSRKLGIAPELMRIRILRIRSGLQTCIRDCLEKKLTKLSEDFVIIN